MYVHGGECVDLYVHGGECVDLHIPLICTFLHIFLLALVILLRANELSLQVMSVRLISSSLVF